MLCFMRTNIARDIIQVHKILLNVVLVEDRRFAMEISDSSSDQVWSLIPWFFAGHQ
jgi:hypothetical protein